MNNKIPVKIAVIILAALIALSPLYFLGIRGSFYYHYHQPDTLIPEARDTETRELSPGVTAVQYFYPQRSHIASLSYYIVAVPGDPQDAALHVSISDRKGRALWRSERKLTEVGNAVLYEDRVRVSGYPLRVDKSEIYCVSMNVDGCPGDQYPSLVLTGDVASVPGLSGFSVSRGETVEETAMDRSIYLGCGYPREPSRWVILFSTLLSMVLSFTVLKCFAGRKWSCEAFPDDAAKEESAREGGAVADDAAKEEATIGCEALPDDAAKEMGPESCGAGVGTKTGVPASRGETCASGVRSDAATGVVTAAILTVWYLMSIPDIVSRLLGVSLDPSWRWFLNIAHGKGIVFGRDVFFSYGPLGFVYYLMNADNPGTYAAGLAIWGCLFLIHAFLFFRLFRAVRERRVSVTALVLAFLFYACSFHESWTDNYILFLITLSLVLYDRGDRKAAVPLNILLCFSFFGKITGFIGGFAMTLLYAVMRALTDGRQQEAGQTGRGTGDRAEVRQQEDGASLKRRLKNLLLPLPAAVAMPVLFLAYSRSFTSLGGYLYNLYDNVSGFNQTQQMNDSYSAMDFRCFFMILFAYLVMLILFLAKDRRRACLVLALGMPLFSAYKYGVTAHGMECSAWIAVMPLSALFLILPLWDGTSDASDNGQKKSMELPCTADDGHCDMVGTADEDDTGGTAERKNRVKPELPDGAGNFSLYPVIVTACAVSMAVLFSLCSHGSLEDVIKNTKAKLYTATHLKESTNDPALYTDYPLPKEILSAIRGHSVGIYPWNLAYGAEYTDMDLRFSPPVYDGEEVYNPWLDSMSAEYYRNRGPEFIILQCLTVYDQVNFLNNPLIWEAMKDTYEAVWTDDEFCLLKRRDVPRPEAVRELIKTGTYGKSDEIQCPEGADYCVVHMDYSTAGKIKGLFWRYGVPTIHISYDDGGKDYGTILVPHMISGFSLDYLPKNTWEVRDILNTGSPCRMENFRFGGKGADSMKDTITVDWYRTR
ncbi:MAG: hypothetical protein IJT00_01220 [Lachnospiraceae bacterium]|nr:hypothetical protein [Lachnospiraceae bacterium]